MKMWMQFNVMPRNKSSTKKTLDRMSHTAIILLLKSVLRISLHRIFTLAWLAFTGTLRACSFIRSDPLWPPEKPFFYSVGPQVYGVLLSRSDRVKWFGPKRPTVPTGPRIALSFYYHGRCTGEPMVRLVSSFRSDRIKEQAISSLTFVIILSFNLLCKYCLSLSFHFVRKSLSFFFSKLQWMCFNCI